MQCMVAHRMVLSGLGSATRSITRVYRKRLRGRFGEQRVGKVADVIS